MRNMKRWIAVLMLLTFPGCGMSPAQERTQVATNGETVASSAILKRIGLSLPSSARVEYAEQMPGRDDAARLIMVLDEADWKIVQSRLVDKGSDQPIFSEDDNFHLGSDEDGWKPGEAAALKTAQLPWADGVESLNLGIARAEAGQVRLFVFWHQL